MTDSTVKSCKYSISCSLIDKVCYDFPKSWVSYSVSRFVEVKRIDSVYALPSRVDDTLKGIDIASSQSPSHNELKAFSTAKLS